jgi:hypothetical protein
MPSNEGSLSERVASSFRQLSAVASDLNTVSDELGKPISELDVALKKLNLGVEVWVQLRGGDDPPPEDLSFWSEDLGYAKVGGRWGIALRTIFGDYNYPDQESVETWLFNDAPRSMRLLGIGKIPELLEKLSTEAAEATNKIKGKLAEAHQVAAVVKEAAEESMRVPFKSKGPVNPFGPPKGQKK